MNIPFCDGVSKGDDVTERLRQMDRDRIVERIWRKDHTVWQDDLTEITDRLAGSRSPT